MNSVTPFDLSRSSAVDTQNTVYTTTIVIVPLCRFFAQHQDALRHAARLLGGSDSALNVDLIAQALERLTITRGTRSRLRDLLGLLTLENVHDMDRVEAGLFSQIDPNDPVVKEICLLADGLQSALHEMLGLEDVLSPGLSRSK